MTETILVVGATGNVGGHLLSLLGGSDVRAATRDPAAAASRVGPSAHPVRFDLDDPSTYAPALEGVARVFLVARPGDDHPHRTAVPLVDEMKRQGVRHVVDLSAMGAEKRPDVGLRQVELHIERSGMGYTHLRPNWFMQIFSTPPLVAGIRATGAIRVPAASARLSFVDVRDVASVAATALTTDDHAGRAYTLTGPGALTHGDVAGLISAASGREVSYDPVDEEQTREILRSVGMPPARIERLVGFYSLVRAGFCEPVTGDVETVLGHPARTFERFAVDHSSLWRSIA